ncbi:MAG: hypothetical protein GYA21_13715 [Myxococcales bacterium]|nr:hypothetical protein [Myxococcales bacterium]
MRLVIARCLLALVLGAPLAAPAARAADFQPRLAKVIPEVGSQYDLELLAVGAAADRARRALELSATLPPFSKINMLEDSQPLLGWVAVAVLLEQALAAGTVEPAAEWEARLLECYRAFAGMERVRNLLQPAVEMYRLQAGANHPLVQLLDRLRDLPPYAREGILWLARRTLPRAGVPEAHRASLLAALVETHRRLGRYADMERAALTLEEIGGPGPASVWLAEALFEQGKAPAAEAALQRAQKAGADLQPAELRRELVALIKKVPKKISSPEMARLAEILLQLEEPWRLTSTLNPAVVTQSDLPLLQRDYLDALVLSGAPAERIRDFARSARATPPHPALLGRRIGLGLLEFLKILVNPGKAGSASRDEDLLRADLVAFAAVEARLANLTRLFIDLARYSRDPTRPVPPDSLRRDVEAFAQAYPDDPAGLQMVYLLRQLGELGVDVPAAIQRFAKASQGKPFPPELLPVMAGQAIREALKQKSAAELKPIQEWIAARLAEKRTQQWLLWRAHLLAVEALVGVPEEVSRRIPQVAAAYQEAMQAYAAAEGDERDPVVLCDSVTALSTLLMEGQQSKEALDLIEQMAPICGQDPTQLALKTILSLLGGDPAGEALKKSLAAQADRFADLHTQLQCRLWLALSESDPGKVRAHARQAKELLAQAGQKGIPVFLAPDLRALVSFTGAFQMQAGYAPQSPFGLSISAAVTSRMTLFPPAAVDEGRLSEMAAQK